MTAIVSNCAASTDWNYKMTKQVTLQQIKALNKGDTSSYYSILGNLQNEVAQHTDIMTITGFMTWEQMIEHANRYANRLN